MLDEESKYQQQCYKSVQHSHKFRKKCCLLLSFNQIDANMSSLVAGV